MNAWLTVSRFWQPIIEAPLWVVLLVKLTAILLAAWLAHLALRRTNPRWRVFLWRVTAVGLVVLPAVAWMLPSLPIHVRPPVKETEVATFDRPTLGHLSLGMIDNLPEEPPAMLPSPASGRGVGGEGGGEFVATKKHASPLPALSQRERGLLLSAWFLGVVILAFRLWVGHEQVRRLIARARPAPAAIQAECARVAGTIGCRARVKVVRSAAVSAPLLCGLRRPLLVLPRRMCDVLYARDLPGILAHELTHVRSHDVHWNVGLQVLSIVLWFHPLAWRMRKAHLAACELVCDAASASFVGDVTDYCRTLARVAVEACGSLPAAGIAMARTSAISRRLAALRTRVFHLPLRRRSVLGVGFAALLTVAVLGALRFAFATQPVVATEKRDTKPAKLGGADKEKTKPAEKPTKPAEKPAQPTNIAPPIAVGAVHFSAADAAGKPIPGAKVKVEAESGTLLASWLALADPKPAAKAPLKPGFRPLQVHVSDTEGKPIRNVRLTVRGTTNVSFGPFLYRTDAAGDATLEAPKEGIKDYVIFVGKDRYVGGGAAWRGDGVEIRVPEKVAFVLERGVPLGGIVQDEQGKPVANVEVKAEGRQPSSNAERWLSFNETAKTDAKGRWLVRGVPKDLANFDLRITLKRPDAAGAERLDKTSLPLDKLRAQTAVLVLRKGIAVEGLVSDPQGKPAAGVSVGLMPESFGSDFPMTTTDRAGHYRFAVSAPGEYTVVAAAKDCAPDSRRIAVATRPQTVDLRLGKGERIRLRVVDKNGKPLGGATLGTVFNNEHVAALFVDYRRACDRDKDRHMRADAEGRWSRVWIPGDPLTLIISKPGYAEVQKKFTPGGEEEVVTLEAGGWVISGRVVDRRTKAPVTRFRVVEGYVYGEGAYSVTWHEGGLVEDKDGRYRAAWNRRDDRRLIRIEADGYYASEASPAFGSEKQLTFNVALQKGPDITGIVRAPDGKPLADAEVALCTATRGLYVQNGRPLQGQPHFIVRTAADGRFSLPPQRDRYALVVLADRGVAIVDNERDAKEITLRPWARAEGTLRANNKPGANDNVVINFGDDLAPPPRSVLGQIANMMQVEAPPPRIHWDYRMAPDAAGHFVFDRVRPGKATISRSVRVSQQGGMSRWTATDSKLVEFIPGETLKVDLGGPGGP